MVGKKSPAPGGSSRKTPGEPALAQRLRRNISPKNLDSTAGLSWREERELNKALYASLQETKKLATKYELEQDPPIVPSNSVPRRNLLARVLPRRHSPRSSKPVAPVKSNVSMRSPTLPPPSDKKLKSQHSIGGDESSQDSMRSSTTSCSNDDSKGTKVRAQRKFAQMHAYGNTMVPSQHTPVKQSSKTSSPIKVFPKRAKTEDFLTFLCLRGTQALPPHLDFFNFSRNEGDTSLPPTPPNRGRAFVRESSPSSSSTSCSNMPDEAADSPAPLVMPPSGRVTPSRKAARACAGTPETARGHASFPSRQGQRSQATSRRRQVCTSPAITPAKSTRSYRNGTPSPTKRTKGKASPGKMTDAERLSIKRKAIATLTSSKLSPDKKTRRKSLFVDQSEMDEKPGRQRQTKVTSVLDTSSVVTGTNSCGQEVKDGEGVSKSYDEVDIKPPAVCSPSIADVAYACNNTIPLAMSTPACSTSNSATSCLDNDSSKLSKNYSSTTIMPTGFKSNLIDKFSSFPIQNHSLSSEEDMPCPAQTLVEDIPCPTQSTVEEDMPCPAQSSVEEPMACPTPNPVEDMPSPIPTLVENMPCLTLTPVEDTPCPVQPSVEEDMPCPIQTPVEDMPCPTQTSIEDFLCPTQTPSEEDMSCPLQSSVKEDMPCPIQTPVEDMPCPTQTLVEDMSCPTQIPVEDDMPCPMPFSVEEDMPCPIQTPVEDMPCPTQTPVEECPTQTQVEDMPCPTQIPDEDMPCSTQTPIEDILCPTQAPVLEDMPCPRETPVEEVMPCPTQIPDEDMPCPTQSSVEDGMSCPSQTPVKEMPCSTQTPIEDMLCPTQAPVLEDMPCPRETPVEEVMPCPTQTSVEDIPCLTQTFIEDMPCPTQTPVEEVIPCPTQTPVEDLSCPAQTPVEGIPCPTQSLVNDMSCPIQTPVEKVMPCPTQTPVEDMLCPAQAPVLEDMPCPRETPVEEVMPCPTQTHVDEVMPCPTQIPVEDMPCPTQTPVEDMSCPTQTPVEEVMPCPTQTLVEDMPCPTRTPVEDMPCPTQTPVVDMSCPTQTIVEEVMPCPTQTHVDEVMSCPAQTPVEDLPCPTQTPVEEDMACSTQTPVEEPTPCSSKAVSMPADVTSPFSTFQSPSMSTKNVISCHVSTEEYIPCTSQNDPLSSKDINLCSIETQLTFTDDYIPGLPQPDPICTEQYIASPSQPSPVSVKSIIPCPIETHLVSTDHEDLFSYPSTQVPSIPTTKDVISCPSSIEDFIPCSSKLLADSHHRPIPAYLPLSPKFGPVIKAGFNKESVKSDCQSRYLDIEVRKNRKQDITHSYPSQTLINNNQNILTNESESEKSMHLNLSPGLNVSSDNTFHSEMTFENEEKSTRTEKGMLISFSDSMWTGLEDESLPEDKIKRVVTRPQQMVKMIPPPVSMGCAANIDDSGFVDSCLDSPLLESPLPKTVPKCKGILSKCKYKCSPSSKSKTKKEAFVSFLLPPMATPPKSKSHVRYAPSPPVRSCSTSKIMRIDPPMSNVVDPPACHMIASPTSDFPTSPIGERPLSGKPVVHARVDNCPIRASASILPHPAPPYSVLASIREQNLAIKSLDAVSLLSSANEVQPSDGLRPPVRTLYPSPPGLCYREIPH